MLNTSQVKLQRLCLSIEIIFAILMKNVGGEDMETQKYETFLKIVELGNITKAAEILGYSQSAISHVVASLENEWDVKLLFRNKQGVRLTREGEALVPGMQKVVQGNKDLIHQVSELHHLESGILHVGAFHSASMHLLPKLIKSFQDIYPQVQFHIKQRGYVELEQMVLEGELDCAIMRLPVEAPIDTQPLFKDRVLAVFQEGKGPTTKRFPLKDLEQEAFIMIKELELEVLQYVEKHGLKLNQKTVSDYNYTLLPMIANGLGMCILPEMMLQDTPYVFTLKELEPPAFRTIGFGYQKNFLSSAARKFMNHAKEYVSEQTDFITDF